MFRVIALGIAAIVVAAAHLLADRLARRGPGG